MPCDLSKAYFGPRLPAEACSSCKRLVHPVQVHGHVQCPLCRNVIETCCEGQTQARVAEVVVSGR